MNIWTTTKHPHWTETSFDLPGSYEKLKTLMIRLLLVSQATASNVIGIDPI